MTKEQEAVYVLVHTIWDNEYEKIGENPKISIVGVYKDRLEMEVELQKITDIYYRQYYINTRYNSDDWIVNHHRERIEVKEVILYE